MMVVYDAPTPSAAAVGSSNAIRSFWTTPLLTVDEMMEVFRTAGSLGCRAPTEAHVTA